MSATLTTSLENCFGDLRDPRVSGCCDHKLLDIIIIAVCGVLCGTDSWVGIETVGKAKESWFREFLDLAHGIPSHDTFGYVFAKLDHEEFQRRLVQWVEAVMRVTKGQVVAIDGKTMRRSHDKTSGKEAIHLVSAWASENGIVLGQRKVDRKTNEITVIPELLGLLNVTGCLVTIDAMGCQTNIMTLWLFIRWHFPSCLSAKKRCLTHTTRRTSQVSGTPLNSFNQCVPLR